MRDLLGNICKTVVFILPEISRKKRLAKILLFRSSHTQTFTSVFKNFAQFTNKPPLPESLLNKVADSKRVSLLEKRPPHGSFSVSFAKFYKTPTGKYF